MIADVYYIFSINRLIKQNLIVHPYRMAFRDYSGGTVVAKMTITMGLPLMTSIYSSNLCCESLESFSTIIECIGLPHSLHIEID